MSIPLNRNQMLHANFNDKMARVVTDGLYRGTKNLVFTAQRASDAVAPYEVRRIQIDMETTELALLPNVEGQALYRELEKDMFFLEERLHALNAKDDVHQTLSDYFGREQNRVDVAKALLALHGNKIPVELKDECMAAANALQSSLDTVAEKMRDLSRASQTLIEYAETVRASIPPLE